MLKVTLNKLKPQAKEIITKNTLGSELEEASQNRFSIVASCVTSIFEHQQILCSVIINLKKKKKLMTQYGVQPYRRSCGRTVLMQIWFASWNSSTTRPHVQSK